MWWGRRGQTVEHQLIASLEDQVSFLRSELDSRTRETERLHDLLAQKEQNIQALAMPNVTLPFVDPAERPVHTYLSQLLPVVVLAVVGGGAAIASFFTVEDSTVKWMITSINITAIVSLFTMNRLSKRMTAIDEENRKNPAVAQRYMRYAVMSAGLYILGVILFVVSTVLYAMN